MLARLVLVAAFFATLSAVSLEAQSSGLTLLGTLDPNSTIYGDIWGYTAPGGTEYALLCNLGFGLSIIDITEDQPVEVGHFHGSGDSFDVKVYDHYAFLAHNDASLQIIDLADPTNPVQVGGVSAPAHNIAISGDYLYMMGGAPQGLGIYSLSPDPTSPQFVGSYSPYNYHDILVRGDTLYAAAIYGEGIDILDISDRANPSLIANFNYPGSGAHNVCSTDDGSHIFVGDEIGAGQWTRTFDVRDPHNVTLVSELIVNSNATVHNCYVKDDILYLAHYDEGVRVWDVRDPENPVEIAYYVTEDAWTAFPYFASGKLIASDFVGGLFVFVLNNLEPAAELPRAFALEAAYPNPFNSSTTLRFSLESEAEVRLAVLDALGREVGLVAEGTYAEGQHEAIFDAEHLPSGLYLVQLESNGRMDSQRITLLK